MNRGAQTTPEGTSVANSDSPEKTGRAADAA